MTTTKFKINLCLAVISIVYKFNNIWLREKIREQEPIFGHVYGCNRQKMVKLNALSTTAGALKHFKSKKEKFD